MNTTEKTLLAHNSAWGKYICYSLQVKLFTYLQEQFLNLHIVKYRTVSPGPFTKSTNILPFAYTQSTHRKGKVNGGQWIREQ